MSYDLATLTGNAYLDWVPISGFPFTLACVAQHSSLATEGYPLGVCKYTNNNASFFLGFRGDLSGDPVIARRIPNSGAGGSNSPQSAGYSINTTTRIMAVFNAANDVRLYVNGAKTTTTTSVDAPTDATRTSIGAFHASSTFSARCALVQQCAAWSAALTDDEAASHAAGFSPRRLRPQSLTMYVPCLRLAANLIGGQTVNNTNVTQSPHMRTYGM